MKTPCTVQEFVCGHLAPRTPPKPESEDFASQLLGRSLWTYDGHVSAYVRLVERLLYTPSNPGDPPVNPNERVTFTRMRCLDIANVSVLEKFQGRGYFRRWYQEVEELAREFHLCVYVESIMNPIILNHCIKQGFTQNSPYGELGPPCYHKKF